VQVLKDKFPGVRLSHDVCSVEALPKETELLVAGFPCIDVSRAGLRRGIDGQSTGLVKHVFRLLKVANDAMRPISWVLLENVEALLDRIDDQPPAIAYIVQRLEELGYGSWAYRVISSTGFGVPMRRRRVFIVASMHGDARDVLLTQGMQGCFGACKELFEGNVCFQCHQKQLKERNSNSSVSFAIDLGQAMARPGEDVVPSLTTSNDRILLLLRDGRVGMLRVEDGERLQGLPEGWTRKCFPVTGEGVSGHRRMHAKEADIDAHTSRRWQLIGNAVTVDVARWLGERLMNPYSHKYRQTEGTFRIDGLLNEEQGKRSQRGREERAAANVWSFVSMDQIQEAAIFPFKDSAEHKQARLSWLQLQKKAAEDAEQIGSDCHNNSLGVVQKHDIKGKRGRKRAIDREQPLPVDNPQVTTPNQANEERNNWTKKVQQGETKDDPRDAAVPDGTLQPYKAKFQAKTYNKIKKGLLQSSSAKDKTGPMFQSTDKTWPKCAWRQNMIGTFGVTKCNDHPVLCPFQTLDEYVEQVGRSPTAEERAGYVHRLKEKGWDISEELLRRISGAQNLASKSAGVTRIEGLLDDADMVGELVWAPWKDASDVTGETFWPGEVLDPTAMPIGRALPKQALERLSSDEKRASTISLSHSWDHNDYAASEYRRVLVMFFPVNYGKWQWYHPRSLLPWKENRPEYEKKAHDAIKRTNFAHGETLEQALQDAVASHGVKTKKSSITSDKMRQTRAAAASAMVDLKNRCGRCRTCMNAYAGAKRYDCLTQRMTASALGGHAGAQLSMCGDSAIGARVAVWWDGDEEYFEGTLCWYDPVSTEHTVAYDDGEIGMHRLWQHDEHILIQSEPDEWPEEATAVRERLQKAMQEPLSELMSEQDVQNNRRASELASRMPKLTEYEQKRQTNLESIKNKFKLFLGLDA
jgi:site-specific DNA-cytosine methylase